MSSSARVARSNGSRSGQRRPSRTCSNQPSPSGLVQRSRRSWMSPQGRPPDSPGLPSTPDCGGTGNHPWQSWILHNDAAQPPQTAGCLQDTWRTARLPKAAPHPRRIPQEASPGSKVSPYAEMCSGPSAIAARASSSHCSSVCPGSPHIRSRLKLAQPLPVWPGTPPAPHSPCAAVRASPASRHAATARPANPVDARRQKPALLFPP